MLKKNVKEKTCTNQKKPHLKNKKQPTTALTGRPNSRRTRAERGSIPLTGEA
jgi:hypothetical protein